MPAHRRKQSNTMLYTLIIFVGLFIVATTVAVFYYIKAEEFRVSSDDSKKELNQYATAEEQSEVGSLVGARNIPASYLGTVLERFDNAVSLIVGGLPVATSTEVKIGNAKNQAANMLKESEPYIGTMDPNLTGLVQVVTALNQKLQNTIDSRDKLQKTLNDSVTEFQKTQEANLAAYKTLLNEKENLRRDYNDVKQDYDDLSQLLQETTGEQVQSLQSQLDREKANSKKLNDELLEANAKLSDAQRMLADAKKELAGFAGEPNRDSMAYMPDGQILSIDNNAKIVYVNLGSNNHVYRGLTFAVYDKGAYIGQEGQDKAEIEIFDISDTYSAARITRSELNRPIMKNDIAANLIWDSRKANQFVLAGEFDLNDDGINDYDALAKIKATVEKWGGKVTDKISIDTDFVILGQQPQVLEKPSLEEQEIDPTALQRYESAVEGLNRYNEIQSRAQSLWIPIFTYKKFIHLIGYSSKIGLAGTF